jgi:succinate dehydrogenase / fumarate reductase cytochrome b subunit
LPTARRIARVDLPYPPSTISQARNDHEIRNRPGIATEIDMAQSGRPLSPHLQIYRWYFTMALSVAHRGTGIVLALGLVLLTWWLTALASGPDYFGLVRAVMDNFLGGLVLFGMTLVLFFHLANGIRHLAWDAGWGFEKDQAHQTGVVVVVATAVLTLLTWILVLVIG